MIWTQVAPDLAENVRCTHSFCSFCRLLISEYEKQKIVLLHCLTQSEQLGLMV